MSKHSQRQDESFAVHLIKSFTISAVSIGGMMTGLILVSTIADKVKAHKANDTTQPQSDQN